MSSPPINTATLANISVNKCKYAERMLILLLESFLSSNTLKPFAKIAIKASQITKLDAIS